MNPPHRNRNLSPHPHNTRSFLWKLSPFRSDGGGGGIQPAIRTDRFC